MVPIYAVCTALGVVGIITWVTLGMTAQAWDRPALDPEDRFGQRGRTAVAALLGFGLGGMSASFAGWNTALALVGAAAGAVVAVVAGNYLGVEESGGGDSA